MIYAQGKLCLPVDDVRNTSVNVVHRLCTAFKYAAVSIVHTSQRFSRLQDSGNRIWSSACNNSQVHFAEIVQHL